MLIPTRIPAKLSFLAAAALAAPLLAAAPPAAANDGGWRISINHHDRGHSQSHATHHRERRGYYKSIWRPPVYRTQYDDCGRAVRVCVRRGFFEKVWVPKSRPHFSHHATYHKPRFTRPHRDHRRHDDRFARRGCW